MDWNIKRMFGIGVTPACPLADSSTIFIDTTDSSYQLDPPPTQFLSYGSGSYDILTPYTIHIKRDLYLSLSYCH